MASCTNVSENFLRKALRSSCSILQRSALGFVFSLTACGWVDGLSGSASSTAILDTKQSAVSNASATASTSAQAVSPIITTELIPVALNPNSSPTASTAPVTSTVASTPSSNSEAAQSATSVVPIAPTTQTSAATPASPSTTAVTTKSAPSVTTPDALNTITISEPINTARSNYPLQIGRAFAKAKFPGNVQLKIDGVSLKTQTDIKNRWPDGSIRFAVLSTVIPSIAPGAKLKVEFESLTTTSAEAPTLTSFLDANPNFDAAISVVIGSSPVNKVGLRQMLRTATVQAWTQGPISSSYIVADHSASRSFDFGVSNLKSVRPIFHVTVWHGLSLAKVRFIAENSNSEGLEDAAYDLSLQIGTGASQKTVYSQSAVNQHVGSRWTKTAWYGSDPKPLSINHNVSYLAGLGIVPNFDPNFAITETTIASQVTRWNASSTALFDQGLWTKYMPAPGGREEIALFPNWTVDALISGDYRLHQISEANADLAAAWPMHFREGSSTKQFDAAQSVKALGAPVSLYARPSMWFGTGNYFIKGSWISATDQFTWGTTVTDGGWVPDGSHQPSPYLVPYLFSGDYWYLEQMQFWASWGALLAGLDLNSGFYGRGPTYTNANLSGDIRTQAWTLRNRAAAASFSVDGTKEKSYFEALVLEAINIAEGIRGITGSANSGNAAWQWGATTGRTGFYGDLGVHPLHMWDNGSESFAQQYQGLYNTPLERAFAPFQMGYIILALDHAKGLGYPTEKLLSWASVFITEATKSNSTAPLLGNFDIPSVTSGTRANIATWSAAAAMYKDPAYPSTFADAWLNSPDGMPLIMTAATATIVDQTGGLDSWQWVKANWVDKRIYPVTSRWAIIPKTK
jgi:hypothetical protein